MSLILICVSIFMMFCVKNINTINLQSINKVVLLKLILLFYEVSAMMINLNTNISKNTVQPLRFKGTVTDATMVAEDALMKSHAKKTLVRSLALPKPNYPTNQEAVINGTEKTFSFIKKVINSLK